MTAPDSPEETVPAEAPAATPKRKRSRARDGASAPAASGSEPAAKSKGDASVAPSEPKEEGSSPAEPSIPKRATLSADARRLLATRRTLDQRRPIFGRQAANRYFRIGRDGSWRRPRGLQSKQRRHYGYRSKIVRIGYRSPKGVRGLVPSGFAPVPVSTPKDLEEIDGRKEAAVIARTVGTRRRLVLEEAARKLGIRVLNPIVKGEEET